MGGWTGVLYTPEYMIERCWELVCIEKQPARALKAFCLFFVLLGPRGVMLQILAHSVFGLL